MIRNTSTILLTFFLVAGSAYAKPKIQKRSFSHGTVERSYYLYAPKSLAETGVPLLLTFHGTGRNGKSIVEKWTKLADHHGFVVAGLDSRDPEIWRSPNDGPDVLRALVKSIAEELPILEGRVYLFGHSGGAVFALMMALMESEYFAAAAVHAGSFRSPGEHAVIQMATRGIPIKIIIGDRDKFFPLASVDSTAAALREQGVPVEVEVVKGHDHWYYSKAKKLNESAWAFLAAHELSAAPNHTDDSS
jgi:poly(3-hydroxybutyrate) depolymerase